MSPRDRTAAPRGLRRLLPLLAEEPALLGLLGRLSAAMAVPEPARAMTVAGLSAASERRPLLVATPTRVEAESLAFDLAAFLGPEGVEELPAWETLPFERVSPSIETMGRRSRVLHRLTDPDAPGGAPAVIVASARALAQRVDTAAETAPAVLAAGDIVERDRLVEQLAAFGYRREHQVEHRGEMAVRGSILDIYPSTGPAPVRIDAWGDEIDRLTEFSADDQRATMPLEAVDIYPCREMRPDPATRRKAAELAGSEPWGRRHWERLAAGELFEGMESWWPWLARSPATVAEAIPADGAVVLMEPRRLRDRVSCIRADEEDLVSVLAKTWDADASEVPRLHAAFEELSTPEHVPVWSMPTAPDSPGMPAVAAAGWPRTPGEVEAGARRVARLLADDWEVVLCADDAARARRLADLLADNDARLSQPVVQVALERGAVFSELKLAVLTAGDITGARRTRRRLLLSRPPRGGARAVGAGGRRRVFEDLSPGSFVVHDHHGVARFEGMVRRSIGGNEREYMLLAYRGDDRLYVPSDQTGQVRCYTGGDTPTLSRMGGSDWSAAKRRVRRAVAEVAQDLVELYRRRITAAGHAFGEDTPWQRELEDSFQHEETRDQLRALAEVKADMERPFPMDRMVVGDVGFGKTEIAVRAAFKAVMDGRQAAVLVPTTLLAHQHKRTLEDRFAAFSVRVEMLSRFLTRAEARAVVDGLRSGEVDMVVGTHRLLSDDVRFKRLGLLIVDEEQRFGVRHKEAIKSLRSDVDVLTLTATPVPRTLEMSLTGIRDLSVLNTPPTDRQPILTYVGEQDPRPVAEAVRRELMREGQVFYVHNRVADIDSAARRLRRAVPEARVAVAHGQMDEAALEKVVMDFSEQKHDVLVCTTIIESGIDMPTVNTLVVDRSDRLGLGQLHQIRGRVGRSDRRAYAYLFYPPDHVLTEQAHERLKTIGEAVELGSGYRIAMRDLEIRGAGNLLGEAQSGHIAAVGYDLYCQLVSEAVAELKGEARAAPADARIEVPVGARIPVGYMAREASRLESYRRISDAAEPSDLDDLEAEWKDRYGPPPPEAEALIALGRLRLDCVRSGISEVFVADSGRAGVGAHAARYRARLAPVRLPASRRVRLKRLYGDGAVYKADASELYVQLRVGARALTGRLRKLIAEIVADDGPPAASGGSPPAAARPGGGVRRRPAREQPRRERLG